MGTSKKEWYNMNNLKLLVQALVITVIVGLLVIGIYKFVRYWNYQFGYESQVEQTVCRMIKPEYVNPNTYAEVNK